ncbi:MAG: SoxR reducing system RseC family protein [Bacteroidota bacterium]
MSDTATIQHRGIVESVEKDFVKVKITSHAACSSCQAKSVCGTTESKDIVIDITTFCGIVSPGEEVDVVLEPSAGFMALFFGYILPFIILMIALVILLQITDNELLSGIISIALLIPYYFGLYFLRDRLKKNFIFTLRKLV